MVGLVGANYTLYCEVGWTYVFKYSPKSPTLSDSPELTPLATPVKSLLQLLLTEANYSVRARSFDWYSIASVLCIHAV
jgi:hypothetical protein